jgi:hypothetical protein
MTTNMSPRELVKLIREVAVDDHISSKVEMLKTVLPERAGDFWAEAIALFRSLRPADRATLISMLRQTAIDTVADVLNVVDGRKADTSRHNEFELRSEDGEKLSDDLTDLFLAHYQRH